MRKILCTLLSLVMALSLFCGLNVSAAQVNLMTNGGFSEYKVNDDPSSGPKGWIYSKTGTDTQEITGWSDVFVTGENNFISLPYGNWMLGSSYVAGDPGSAFEIAYRYLSQTDDRARVLVTFHTYDQSTEQYSNEIANETLIKAFATTNGQWQRTSFKIVMPEGATHFKITLRSNVYVGAKTGSETLYFDDVSAYLAPEEVLYNPDMENTEGNMPLGWYANEGTAGTDYAVSTNSYAGQYSLQINGNSTAPVTVYNNIPTEKDVSYIISGYVKVESVAGTASLKLSKDNVNGTSLGTKTLTTTNGVWKKITMSSAAGGFGGMALSLTVTGTGTVYFDSFRIEKDNNLLTNSSVEALTKNAENSITAVQGWSLGSGVTWDGCIASDGNAYDGSNYIKFSGSLGNKLVQITPTLIPGGTYKLTIPYSSSVKAARVKIEFAVAAVSGQSPIIDLPNTNRDWKKFNTIFKVPEGNTTGLVRIQVRNTTASFTNDNYVAYDALRLDLVTEPVLGFYDNTGFSISTSTTGVCELLGYEVESLSAGTLPIRFHASGLEQSVSMITVLYSNNSNGIKSPISITANTVPLTTSDISSDIGFKGSVAIGTLEDGKDYYLETYIWDNLSDLKPLIGKQIIRN